MLVTPQSSCLFAQGLLERSKRSRGSHVGPDAGMESCRSSRDASFSRSAAGRWKYEESDPSTLEHCNFQSDILESTREKTYK